MVLAAGCTLACPVCDCRARETAPAEVLRTMDRGGALLEVRGEAALQTDLGEHVRRAREGGWRSVRVRTNGVAYAAPGRARELAALGVDGVVFFVASERPEVHDAIARVRGAHAAGLAGLKALVEAGLEVSLEVPVLDPAVQDLRALLTQVLEVAPEARRLRLYSPVALRSVDGKVSAKASPPRWDRVRGPLGQAIAFARERGLEVSFNERDGVPLCALATVDDAGQVTVPEGLLSERGGRPMPRRDTSSLGAVCDGCPAARMCPGTTTLYLSRHGDAGLAPLPALPQVSGGQGWDATKRQAARTAFLTVLRPTVHCNQDCWFCSANETSRNVYEDPGKMLRRISRLARAGVQQISFSGGEPTLSRHLASYVKVARRLGVSRVELVTNAVLLDKPRKVEALMEAGLTHLFVSLHAHDEPLSRLQTRKIGDHARTVAALKLFARHEGLRIDVNHVVSGANYRSLVRFFEWLHAEFGDRIGVSLAFVTPQYKALEHLGDKVPRYSEVVPYLKRALARAVELGIGVIVGSRQGVPPCQLGEFLPLSDILSSVSGALTEDAHQKQQGPACADCRFEQVCTGVWKQYAALYGTDELVALPGPKLTPAEAKAEAESGRGDLGLSEALRYGDGRMPRSHEIPLPGEAAAEAASTGGGAPVRVALVGTGTRALLFARTMARVGGFALVGVASPHAPDKELPELPEGLPRARDLGALLDQVAADAVIVASRTAHHAEAARVALARGLPCLVEKPLAGALDEAEALAAEGAGRLSVAQQLRASSGVAALLEALGDRKGPRRPVAIEVVHRATATSPGSLRAWSRRALYELLIHLGDVALALADEPLTPRRASASGGGRPERVVVTSRGQGRTGVEATIELALDAPADGLRVGVRFADGRGLTWVREDGRDELEVTEAAGGRTRTPPRGGDLERLLTAWREHLRGGASPADGAAGVAAMRLASEMLRALEEAGAPFDRAAAPMRVASGPLRERVGS